MSVYIDSLEDIKKQIGINNNGSLNAFIVNTCYKAMDEFVPRDIGNLRKNVALYNDRVVYESPYASYIYRGMREDGSHKVRYWTTRGTGPYWDKRMISAKMDKIIDDIERKIGR